MFLRLWNKSAYSDTERKLLSGIKYELEQAFPADNLPEFFSFEDDPAGKISNPRYATNTRTNT